MFWQVISVHEYSDPEILPFRSQGEAIIAASKIMKQLYGVELDTLKAINKYEMKSGCYLWITPLQLPKGTPLYFVCVNYGLEGDDATCFLNRYFLTEAEATGYAATANALPEYVGNFKVVKILPN